VRSCSGLAVLTKRTSTALAAGLVIYGQRDTVPPDIAFVNGADAFHVGQEELIDCKALSWWMNAWRPEWWQCQAARYVCVFIKVYIKVKVSLISNSHKWCSWLSGLGFFNLSRIWNLDHPG
jgi:hypothetical protein